MQRRSTATAKPIALAMALAFGAPAYAQQSEQQLPEVKVRAVEDKPAEIGYQPKRASTATKTDAELMEVPQAVNVVPAQVIQDQQVRTLDDALKNVSGITQSNTYGNTSDGFLKRGFGTNGDGSILRDGIRSPFPRSFSPTTERVEVLKGPASLLYGILEPGGVINVISKKPQLQWQGSASLLYNSFGGGAGSIDITGPIGASGVAFRLIAEHEDADYWRNFGVYRNTFVAPSFSWTGERTSLLVQYEHLDFLVPFDRGTVILNGRPAPVPREWRFDEPFNRSEGQTDLVNITLDHRFSDALRTRLTYGWNRLKYDDYQARPRTLNATTGELRRSADGNLGGDNRVRYLAADVVVSAPFAKMRNELVFGADYEVVDGFRRDSLSGGVVGGFNIFNPVYGQLAPPSTVSAAFSDFESRTRSHSVYVQDSLHLTEQWIAVLGLRHQRFDQFEGQGRPFVVTNDSEGSKTLPRAGLVWRPVRALSVYGNYSESFRPNASTPQGQGPFDPEQGRVYEAGTKFELASGLSGTLAVYDIEKQNVLVTENMITRAVGKVRSRGLELDVAGRLARNWDAVATYAYTDAEILEDVDANTGKELTNVAPHVASIFVVRQFNEITAAGRWRVGGGFRYVGRRPGDTANSFFLDSYTVADAFVGYETKLAGKLARLQLNVKNLFDKTYFPSSGGNLRINVGEPRQVLLQGSVAF